MQPAAASQDPGTVRMVRGWGDGLGEETMVNKEAFWKKGIEEVPASQVRIRVRKIVFYNLPLALLPQVFQ